MGAEHSPTSVTCKMHMLKIFQEKNKKVFQVVHDNLGHARTKDCFQVNIKKNVFTKIGILY